MAELYYPNILTNQNAFPAHVHFSFFERDSTFSSHPTDQIHLYMPEHFGQPSTLSWEQFHGKDAMKSGMDSVIRGVSKLGKLGGQAAGIAERLMAIGGSPAGDLLELQAGQMINPYLAQIFRGVDFRSFDYTFRLVPFNVQDCYTIKEIITIFRKWSLPSGPQGAASPFLGYPGEMDVRYVFMGDDNEFIHRFKRSVITRLDLDYTGAGMWSMMRNGFPAETVLNIAFTELQIVVREDVEDNNY